MPTALPPCVQTFLRAESGAVAVDWVVLSAAVVGMGIAAVGSVRSGISALGSDVSTSLSNASVASLGVLGSDGYSGPWVSRPAFGGHGMVWSEDGTCGKNGVCTPSTTFIVQSYEIDNGEIWTQTSVQVDGQDQVVTWTDPNGDTVDAPRFPD